MRTPRVFGLCCLLIASLILWTGCGNEHTPDLVTPQSAAHSLGNTGVQNSVPTGYYDTVDLTNATTLRNSLHNIIKDHVRFAYTSTSTDTWDILEQADEDPSNPNDILDLYRNASYPKQGGGNTYYQREHTWPKSYGFPNDNSTNYPYTDCHHLFLCDGGYNGSRSNKPYRFCDASCTEKPTLLTDGVGGGSGVYPGNSNWTSGSYTQGTWEVWQDRRGDVARALFYMDVRYEGGTNGNSGAPEPDLILTDDEALIDASNTGSNESVGYMGMLSVLLEWNQEDPVDAKEEHKNDVVYSYQGNRNPFVDHPDWVGCIFGGNCSGGDVTSPAAPTGLVATAGDGSVDLDWTDNTEGDLDGYHVYRATGVGGPFSRIDPALLSSSTYQDSGLSNGTTYYYQVTAVDLSGNESAPSTTQSATPQGGGSGGGIAWINEFHYDNASTDTGEFVEIAGTAGTSLSGWSVVGYNGNGGGTYQTVALSGTLPDQASGFGTLSFAFTGMQNGSPDGLALVDASNQVVEFLSYEGTFTATDGPALGMSSTDVGVSESSSTPVGDSLQRTGSGTAAAEFTWTGPLGESPGQVNAGQSFGGPPPDTTPPDAPTGLVATAGDGVVDLDWADNTEGDLNGYNVLRSTSSGGGYTVLNGSLLSSSLYTDTSVSNGTTYYYVVQALDMVGNASGFSSEVSALPEAPTPVAWINEFHYDNRKTDRNEFVEVAGNAGLDLSGWALVGYNGANGSAYDTISLSGVIPNQLSGFGTLAFDFSGLQNGSPDGIALVDDTGTVVEFLSYEGSFSATDGPASGMSSTDVGVSEDSSTGNRDSLQRVGTGQLGSDFSWSGPSPSSEGQINSGQTFSSQLRVSIADR